jgi:hypothetical protein
VDLTEAVDEAAIRAAVRFVAARHTGLRTTYPVGADASPRPVVWPVEAEGYALRCFDDAVHAQRWLREGPDIGVVWPLRVAVLDCPREPPGVGLAIHHIAGDRYGFDLLCREFQAAVSAGSRRAAARLPVPTRQPADIAAFERSAGGATVNDRALTYWLSHHAELGGELAALGAGFTRPSGTMHVAQAFSADARKRLSGQATAARSSEAAVAIAAVACALAGYLDRSSVLMFMTSANRHLTGVRHSVCSLAQAGLLRIGVPDPGDLQRVIRAAGLGAMTASRYAYYDDNARVARQRAAGGGGHHLPVTPPSVNVMRVGESALRPPEDWEPDDSEGSPRVRGEVVDRPCSGLNFHVQVSASYLAVELRAGTHLLPAADCEALVAGAIRLLRTAR